MRKTIEYLLLLSVANFCAVLLFVAGQLPEYTPATINVPKGISPAEVERLCSLNDVTGPACAPYENQRSGVASYLHYAVADTCAARDWKYGTKLLVTAGENWIVCTVRDFGPSKALHPERIIDLNAVQFAKLAPTRQGLVHVVVVPS